MLRRFLLQSVLSAFILTAAATAMAQGAAGTGLAFLKLGVGARAVGLGEAYVSVTDDASATYWNPAGLALLGTSQLLLAHTEWLQSVTHDYIGFAAPGFGGGWGLSVVSAGVGDLQSRIKPSAEPIGVFEAHNLALGLSYGRSLTADLSLGFTFKWLYERIFTYEAPGYAVDLGAQFRLGKNGLRLGAVIQNLGSMRELRQQSSRLPTTLRAGASYPVRLGKSRWLLAMDVVKTLHAGSHVNVGGEWLYAQRYAFRVGYQSGFDTRGLQAGAGLAAGRFLFDYGYVPVTQNLGSGHRFSVQIRL